MPLHLVGPRSENVPITIMPFSLMLLLAQST
jgi:hypothetical protein